MSDEKMDALGSESSERLGARFAKDAEEYGNALNEAGWAFLDAYNKTMENSMPPRLFNNLKGMVREAIIAYARKVDA